MKKPWVTWVKLNITELQQNTRIIQRAHCRILILLMYHFNIQSVFSRYTRAKTYFNNFMTSGLLEYHTNIICHIWRCLLDRWWTESCYGSWVLAFASEYIMLDVHPGVVQAGRKWRSMYVRVFVNMSLFSISHKSRWVFTSIYLHLTEI